MVKRDLAGGIIFVLLGLLTLKASLGLEYYSEYGPGPGFMPFWLSLILIVCALLVLIPACKALREGKGKEPVTDEDLLMFTKPTAVFGGLGALLLVAVLLEDIGFVISASIAITIYVKLIKPEFRWGSSVALGVVAAIMIYSLFNLTLGINLPRGVLPI